MLAEITTEAALNFGAVLAVVALAWRVLESLGKRIDDVGKRIDDVTAEMRVNTEALRLLTGQVAALDADLSNVKQRVEEAQ